MVMPPAALLIHGLGGTAYDLGVLDKQLRRAGVATYTLTLPGHGGQPQDLLSIRAEDWLNAVDERYCALRKQHQTLHVIGMCMGALLAIEVVKRRGHTGGSLIALAPPVYLDGWSTPWYRGLRHALYRIPAIATRMRVEEGEPYGIKNDLIRSIVKAKFARGDRFHYPWVPLTCVQQVDRLRQWVLHELNQIRAATLIVHAKDDELTSPRSAHRLARDIPGARVEILQDSYHMICIDNDRDHVRRVVMEHMAWSNHHTPK